ncbi:MAG: DUF2807 domain-containing protein [Anaerolineales bacterium]|jgi:hypothetical protein
MSGIITTEQRAFSGANQVVLHDYGELIITVGDQEGLIIEGDKELIKSIETTVQEGVLHIRIRTGLFDKLGHALSTSLSRKPLRYRLFMKELSGLFIKGAGRARVTDVDTQDMAVSLQGAGSIELPSLTAETLKVNFGGTGRLDIGGEVWSQSILLTGAGNYVAPRLLCAQATVEIRGAGKATVWVQDQLQVAIRGVGSVDYYGTAELRSSKSGVGSVTHLGDAPR